MHHARIHSLSLLLTASSLKFLMMLWPVTSQDPAERALYQNIFSTAYHQEWRRHLQQAVQNYISLYPWYLPPQPAESPGSCGRDQEDSKIYGSVFFPESVSDSEAMGTMHSGTVTVSKQFLYLLLATNTASYIPCFHMTLLVRGQTSQFIT